MTGPELDFTPRGLYIGGEWQEAAEGGRLASINPSTGEHLGEVPPRPGPTSTARCAPPARRPNRSGDGCRSASARRAWSGSPTGSTSTGTSSGSWTAWMPATPSPAWQDFPTLWLIFREADERRPNRHAVVGFRGCGAAHAPTPAPSPAPDDSLWMSGGFAVGPGRCGVSGPCQGGDGLAAVELQPAPGFGETLRLAAVGEDHRERDVVEAGAVRRAVARAGQAGVLTVDAVPLSMVEIFHCPVAAIEAQQLLRRRGPGIEGGDEVDRSRCSPSRPSRRRRGVCSAAPGSG